MIPMEAVTAATNVLYADKMSNHSGDNAPQIIDACEVVVKKILEAAAPYMERHFREGLDALDMGPRSVWHDAVSEAYVEGALSAEQASVMWAKNPYRIPDAR